MSTMETKREHGKQANTERVDDAFVLLRHAVQAADPLAAIAQRADTLDEVRALKRRDEKIPWKQSSERQIREAHTRASIHEKTHISCIAFRSMGTFSWRERGRRGHGRHKGSDQTTRQTR